MSTLAKTIIDKTKHALLRAFGWLRVRFVGKHGVAILTRTKNGLLLVPANDVMVGRRLAFNGVYDPELLESLLSYCQADSRVLFVGAHVGSLVVPVGRKVRRVVAIEANPSTFETLQMNVLLNGLQNVELHNFAAGDRDGQIGFLTSALNSGGSGIDIGERGESAGIYDQPSRIQVPMKRLDDVFPNENFDLIVMDIEGAEALALRGMATLVARSRGLLIEVFENHLRRVAKVSNEEFLGLIQPYFDEAIVFAEKPTAGEPRSSGPYAKSAFREMMLDCCRAGMVNVMFLKDSKRGLA